MDNDYEEWFYDSNRDPDNDCPWQEQFDNGWRFRFDGVDRYHVESPDFTNPVASRDEILSDDARAALFAELEVETPDIEVIEALMATPAPPPSPEFLEMQRKARKAKYEELVKRGKELEADHTEIEPPDLPEDDEPEESKDEIGEVDPNRATWKVRRLDAVLFAAGAAICVGVMTAVSEVVKRGMR